MTASSWNCLFANDFDYTKAISYRDNWGDSNLKVADVATLSTRNVTGRADLAWDSFPRHELSLAGAGAGPRGE
jgi:DNA (cytosine-5)-methyltransferase 1